jgi:MFS superfamily sulfate permease-like transporter
MLAYTLFSSSHQIINGPESTTAILLATTFAPLAMLDSARYAALAGAHALFISFIYLVAGRFRLGFVSDFFSKPILTGYMTGTSIVLQSARSGRCLASVCQVSRSSINSLN